MAVPFRIPQTEDTSATKPPPARLRRGDTAAAPQTRILSFRVPTQPDPSAIETVIQDSEWIFRLQDDWDGEGSRGYSREIWKRATEFLHALAVEHWLSIAPSIAPAENGSIDLYWRLPDRTLLVNFSPESDVASYFGRVVNGDDTTGGYVQGRRNRQQLVAWLTSK